MKLILTENQKVVLKTIIEDGEISRTALSNQTNINKASISEITQFLMTKDLILESGIGDSSIVGGRRPVLLKFNHMAGTSLSIDCSPNKIHGAISFLNGQVIKEVIIQVNKDSSEDYLSYILKMVEKLIEHTPKTTHNIIGLTIAIHGQVKNNQIIFTPNYKLERDLVNKLKKIYSFPIYLENEANLSALGEYSFRSNIEKLVSLNISSGIGAGVVIDGCISEGTRGLVGEIGHTIIKPNGKLCVCGNHGCLEQYTSIDFLLENIEEIIDMEVKSTDIPFLYNSNKKINYKINNHIKYLAIAINNISASFDPDVIVLNCTLYNDFPQIISLIKDNLYSFVTNNISIQNKSTPYKSSLYGGAAMNLNKFLEMQSIQLSD